jgi:hypothetical protein
MIPDRAGNVEGWDFDKLVVILLRQFKRLLAEREITLTDQQMQTIGTQAAAQRYDDAQLPAIKRALDAMIDESLDVLQRWNLTYPAALRTEMTDIPGWESTADFLQLANEKVNAELRINAGSALLAALGDGRRAALLLQTIDHDLQTMGRLDVDATIARRALLHLTRVDGDADDWLAQIRQRLAAS